MSDNETRFPQQQDIEAEDSQQIPVPPATFEYLVATFRFQTEMQLGLLHFGEEKDRPEPNLDLARHFIDLLAMLQGKTRGNLSLEDQRALDNTVTELRFRFVQTAGKSSPGMSEHARIQNHGSWIGHERRRAHGGLPLRGLRVGRPTR